MTDSNSLPANALSLDEVFVQRAPAGSSGKRKLRLTPLSKKSCLIHGIDPSVLREREYASFSKNGQDPEIQTMRFEMYCRTREKLMQVASDERSKLAAQANTSNDSFSTTDSVSIVSKNSMATYLDKEHEISTIIENEKRRLEKIATRQQKEMMTMLAFESKSKEIMDKMSAKTEEQARKEEQRKKEQRKRDLQAAEMARLRELRRKAREDAEVSLHRAQLQGQFERERKIRQKKLREERESKKRALMEEQQRLKKREANRLQTKLRSEQQREETERKIKEREVKEQEREAKLELKRLVDAQAAEAKRKEAADRIESNVKAAGQQQEEKRSGLLQKQARQKEFMDEISRDKEADFGERQWRNEAMDRKRRYQLKKKKENEEATKRVVLSKIEQEEARLKELADRRRKEQMLIKAEKDLQLQMKRENLDRIKRAQEYQLKCQIQKADSNDKRCQELKKRKEELLKIRQKNAYEAKVKKDRLMAVMEQSKSAGGSGIKKLLKSVANGCLFESYKDVNTASGASLTDTANDAESLVLDPPPDAPSFSERFGSNEHSSNTPYKSPYALDDFLDIGQIYINDSPDSNYDV